ncbi:bifunctional protein-disulfide isomerase/oxidoreductase DsbC [Thalassotalea sediminis]|uniref:bifunctional protein-disulfide isomerase/oxidoreductase DsbC n=1 Tax=Thalassotalea sediminis TaxID=1759089 RepID=UPI002572B7F0|nr:bifunctional protein-disulfide isomerase/oxidoreductase DsbC [Thalassotalea sediminis]
MFSKRVFSTVFLCMLVAISGFVGAKEQQANSNNNLSEKLSKLIGLEVQSITPTPVDNLIEVLTDQGLFYASADGQYLIHGKLYGLGENVVNYTEQSLSKVRVEGLARFKDDMIIYPAKDEKHVVTIFTDITCGYCRQLHQQMDEYNKLGITIRYLPYPRAGITDRFGNLSQGFKDLRSIWCHEDPASALTKAKAGSNVAHRICEKPIAEEFEFARKVGVSATPAIIFDNGMMIPGYQKPQALIKVLDSLKSES